MPDFRTVIDGVVSDLGTDVTIYTVSTGTFNEYGDANTTTSTTTATAVIQTLSQEDELVTEGEFKAGDVIFYINSSEGSSINRGDRIETGSAKYEISDIVPYEVSGNVQVYEIRTKVWG